MKIHILKKKDNQIYFLAEDISIAFANTLRRIMIAELPNLAIEWVDISKNTSVMHDETLAHRFGLLPIKFDTSKFNFTSECKCEGKGCSLCQVVFAVKKTGPCMVYSGDMKSANPEVKPASPDFPIVELLDKQEVDLQCVACLGYGYDHAKFQTANAVYEYFPDLPKGSKYVCGRHNEYIKGTKTLVKDPEKCTVCSMSKTIKNPKQFVFKVESISGLKPSTIVETSAAQLASRAREFKEKASKL